MADTTTPVTPAIPAAQDLQINLADAPKVEEITTPENKGPELNLDLDLNLSDAPKDDDRLKTEDQKNNETNGLLDKGGNEGGFVTEATQQEQPVEQKTEMPIAAEPILLETTPEAVAEIAQLETLVEPTEDLSVRRGNEGEVVAEAIQPEQPVEQKTETLVTPVVEEISAPSTTIEAEPITATAPVELQEDMKMIDELE